MKRFLIPAFILLLSSGLFPAQALEQVYLSQADFLSKAFELNTGDNDGSALNPPKTLWWVGDRKKEVTKVLGRDPIGLRTRYWQQGDRTAWILEAIGKEHPITAGYVVESGRILSVDILTYRETRGWEVKFPAFRRQFVGAQLADSSAQAIDQSIDGISGATLSVHAVTAMSRLALWLHDQVANAD